MSLPTAASTASVRRKKRLRYLLIALFLFLLFVLQSLPEGIPAFYLGTPLLVLPMLCAAALFEKEMAGAFFGLLCGLLLDCYGAQGGIYSTVALFLLGGVCGFLGRFVMAENFLAALTLTAGVTFLYLAGKWIVFQLILSPICDFHYLLLYSLPTFVYTTLFTVPFYWLARGLHRIGR